MRREIDSREDALLAAAFAGITGYRGPTVKVWAFNEDGDQAVAVFGTPREDATCAYAAHCMYDPERARWFKHTEGGSRRADGQLTFETADAFYDIEARFGEILDDRMQSRLQVANRLVAVSARDGWFLAVNWDVQPPPSAGLPQVLETPLRPEARVRVVKRKK
jgi:hypothetical protein